MNTQRALGGPRDLNPVVGRGLPNKLISRPVSPYDIAPGVANKRGIRPPSGSAGKLLPEFVTVDRALILQAYRGCQLIAHLG